MNRLEVNDCVLTCTFDMNIVQGLFAERRVDLAEGDDVSSVLWYFDSVSLSTYTVYQPICHANTVICEEYVTLPLYSSFFRISVYIPAERWQGASN